MKEKCVGKGWTSESAFDVWNNRRGTCVECGQEVRATLLNIPQAHYVELETV